MRYSKIGGKILLLLMEGFALTYIKDKHQRKELWKEYDKIWFSIDRKKLFDAFRILKMGGYVNAIRRADGAIAAELTQKGRSRAMRFKLDDLEVKKPKRWDGKWRMVIFDIPEARRKVRDELRKRLKRLGFHEVQKSSFVIPYPCEDEIHVLINAFDLMEEVRILEGAFSYDKDLRKTFGL